MDRIAEILHALIYSRKIKRYTQKKDVRSLSTLLAKPNPTGQAALDRILMLCSENLASVREPLEAAGRDPIATLTARLLERGDSQSDAKGYAARALGELGDRSALNALRTVLEDPDSPVRLAAAWGLCRLGDARGRQALIDFAADRGQPIARRIVTLEQLAALGDPGCIMPFVWILVDLIHLDDLVVVFLKGGKEEQEHLAWQVAKWLGPTGTSGVQVLCDGLGHSDPRVIWQSVQLLGMVAGGGAAIENLVGLMDRCLAAGEPDSYSPAALRSLPFVPTRGYGGWFEVDWIKGGIWEALERIGTEEAQRALDRYRAPRKLPKPPDEVVEKVVVGTCEVCNQPLRVKRRGVSTAMSLTCKCGHLNMLRKGAEEQSSK
jgi:hypothetical protein